MEALSNARSAVGKALSPGGRPRAAFDLKGLTTSFTVLRLRTGDLAQVERQLRVKVTQFPQFFQDAPLLLDLGSIEEGLEGLSLPALVHVLRACRVVPVAVTNVPEALREAVSVAGLGVITPGARSRESDRAPEHEEAAAPAERPRTAAEPAARATEAQPAKSGPRAERQELQQAAQPQATQPQAAQASPGSHVRHALVTRLPLVVRQPVRSGQIVYAEQTDLIVLAPVNPGAQLVADGNIHVYAPLRGRALAGAHGYPDARIFCQKLEAELVSIGDAYVSAENISDTRWGRPTQVFLEDGECQLAPI